MTLAEILKVKGTVVYTIVPELSLDEAVRDMVRHNVGSLLVCNRDMTDGERLLGIITERDIIRFCASGKGELTNVRVADVMTKRVLTGSPTDSVEATMGLMTANRVRHLPIVFEGRLVGLVSIGDVVKSQHDRLALENEFMKNYISG
jgi:CBS domain-containing protein